MVVFELIRNITHHSTKENHVLSLGTWRSLFVLFDIVL